MLNAESQSKAIARAGVSLDKIDVDAAANAGVVIAPLGAYASRVVEHAAAMALALSKHFVASDLATKAGEWYRSAPAELGGRTWGLLPAGATARATARLARGLGMKVIAYDPYIDENHPGITELGIRMALLDTAVVDEEALTDAITSGWGLDVRHSEPPVLGRLEELPNVILTPPVAGITHQAKDRIARILSDEVEAALSGVASTYDVGAHSCCRSVGSR